MTTLPPHPDDELLARALRAERFYPFPPELAARILDDCLAPAWSLKARLLGLAGAVALAVGAVAARTGALPTHPQDLDGLAGAWAAPPVTLPTADLLAAAPTAPAAWMPWLMPVAAALVVGGVWWARRLGRALATPGPGGVS